MRPSQGSLMVALGLVAASGLAGCSSNTSASPPAAATSPGAAPAQVQIQPLTADQLARILGVDVWTARFSGGPIECWLEIEEEGQSTLPKRFPEKAQDAAAAAGLPTEGTIMLYWTRREDRQGGQLTIVTPNASSSLGLDKDSLTFAWRGFGARSTTAGQGEPIRAEPGKDFLIVDYDASESLPAAETRAPRRVHLKLMGRFHADR